jgi:four helix bundle protein
MIIHSLEELLVYQKALAAAHAVSALIERREFRDDPELRDQLATSSSRVPALIAEGFEQKSDRHFAHYLYIARGSASETRTHLLVAVGRQHLSAKEAETPVDEYSQICRMLTRLIQHLERENRANRFQH